LCRRDGIGRWHFAAFKASKSRVNIAHSEAATNRNTVEGYAKSYPRFLAAPRDWAVLRISEKLCKTLDAKLLGPEKLNAGDFVLGVEVDQEHRPTVEDLDGTFGLIFRILDVQGISPRDENDPQY
jgi:hypothetical protein